MRVNYLSTYLLISFFFYNHRLISYKPTLHDVTELFPSFLESQRVQIQLFDTTIHKVQIVTPFNPTPNTDSFQTSVLSDTISRKAYVNNAHASLCESGVRGELIGCRVLPRVQQQSPLLLLCQESARAPGSLPVCARMSCPCQLSSPLTSEVPPAFVRNFSARVVVSPLVTLTLPNHISHSLAASRSRRDLGLLQFPVCVPVVTIGRGGRVSAWGTAHVHK